MYTKTELKEAVKILTTSPLWARYTVAAKAVMVAELAAILYSGR